jgi:predicted nucleotidyltransferase
VTGDAGTYRVLGIDWMHHRVLLDRAGLEWTPIKNVAFEAIHTLDELALAVEGWAESEPLVRKVYLFGSRVRGTYRPDSDLDVAIELLTLPDEDDPGTTWQREAKRLRASIAGAAPVAIDLLWYGGAIESPCVHEGLQAGSLTIYDVDQTAPAIQPK